MSTKTDMRARAAAADTAPRKFMFDHSFDPAVDAARAPERKPVTLRPDQLDALKKESFDAGFAAGQQAGTDAQAKQLMAMLARVEERVAHTIANMQALRQEHDEHLRHMVIAVARKLLPDFMSRQGLQEIQSMLAGVITEMVHEPRLVVRVHESQFDAVNGRIQDISAQKAYAGKVVVLADADIAPDDCRVEWADGGIERNAGATWKDVEKAVAPGDNPKPTPQE